MATRRRLVGFGSCLMIGLLATSACAATATPSPASAVSGSPSAAVSAPAATGSPSPTAASAATPVPSTDVLTLCAGGQSDPTCDLAPGTYSAQPFEPGFRFTISDTWRNERKYADGGSISQGDAAILWASGVKSGTADGAEVNIAAGSAGFIAFLGQIDGFTMSAPSPTLIDGVDGVQVDVETNATDATGIFSIENDMMNLAPGEKVRFILLDKDGTTMIFMVDAFQSADFETFLAKAQPVVDSLTWE